MSGCYPLYLWNLQTFSLHIQDPDLVLVTTLYSPVTTCLPELDVWDRVSGKWFPERGLGKKAQVNEDEQAN